MKTGQKAKPAQSPEQPANLALDVVNQQSVGVAVVGRGQDVLFWNAWLARWTGISADHAVGRNLSDLFSGLVASELMAALTRAANAGKSITWSQELDPERLDLIESAMTQGDREMPLHRVSITPFDAGTGQPDACLLEVAEAPFSPMAARKPSTSVVPNNLSGGRFPVYLDTEEQGVMAIDGFGFIQQINHRMEEMTGFSAAQLCDKPLRVLFPDLTGEDFNEGYRALLTFKKKQHPEGLLEAATVDGKLLQLSVTLLGAVDSRETLVLLCRDATRHAGAQDALFRQRELLSAIYSQVADGIILTDRQGYVENINPVGLELLGLQDNGGHDTYIGDLVSLVDEDGQVISPCEEALQRETTVNLPENTRLLVAGRSPLQVMASATPLRNRKNTITGAVLVFRAVSESRRVSTRLTWQATHDPLTQLPNRRGLENELLKAIDSAHLGEASHTLLYIDLYNFSVVNDSCGHAAGDELLRQFARLLQRELKQDDFIARIGNDEFAILLWNRAAEDARETAETLLWTIKNFSFPWDERRLKIGASIGAKVIDRETTSEIDVLVAAGASCAAAKESGRNRIHFQYHSQDVAKRHSVAQWITRISEALEEDRFVLYCQPIVPVSAGDGAGAKHHEVLVRMVDKNGHIVPPGKFVPAAEHYGLIDDIDRWVLEKVFATLSGLSPKKRKGLRFSVNLSGATIGDEKFRPYLLKMFDDSGLDPHQIQFEITETAAIRYFDRAVQLIHALKGRGCHFSLDDFGSGLSSFGYLKELPVDYLKIDGSFVRNMEVNDVDYSMVSTINHLAHVMGIATIAECVENQTQLYMLEEIGLDYVQGFVISAPVPLESIL